MKWRTLLSTCSLVLIAVLAGCSSGTTPRGGSTAVTITIGSGSGASAALALARPIVTTLLFEISGPNMETIQKSVAVSPPQTITASFDVPNGPARLFTVKAADALGEAAYSGAQTADLDGAPVTLDITMKPLFFAGTRLIGTALDDSGNAIARDNSGNIVIAGDTTGDFFNPRSTVLFNFVGNAFVTKFDVSGEPLWTSQFGTDQGTIAAAVAVDVNGNIFVAGYTGGNLHDQTSNGFTDCFVVKLDPAGNRLWTRLIGGALDDLGNAAAVDTAGNVYVAGSLRSADAADDVFVAKFNSSGDRQWLTSYGTTNTDAAQAVATDAAGSVFVAGFTYDAFTGAQNAGLIDAFVSKLDGQGNVVQTVQLGSADEDQASSLALDSSGTIYVAGTTNGDLNGLPNNDPDRLTSDIFVLRYDAGLALQSALLAGTTAQDTANGIAVDASGNVLVAGSTKGAFTDHTNAGGEDSVVLKFSPAGSLDWVRQLGGSDQDAAKGLVTDGKGNALVAGNTKGTFDGLTSAGLDAFLMMYDTSGVKQ